MLPLKYCRLLIRKIGTNTPITSTDSPLTYYLYGTSNSLLPTTVTSAGGYLTTSSGIICELPIAINSRRAEISIHTKIVTEDDSDTTFTYNGTTYTKSSCYVVLYDLNRLGLSETIPASRLSWKEFLQSYD